MTPDDSKEKMEREFAELRAAAAAQGPLDPVKNFDETLRWLFSSADHATLVEYVIDREHVIEEVAAYALELCRTAVADREGFAEERAYLEEVIRERERTIEQVASYANERDTDATAADAAVLVETAAASAKAAAASERAATSSRARWDKEQKKPGYVAGLQLLRQICAGERSDLATNKAKAAAIVKAGEGAWAYSTALAYVTNPERCAAL